MRRTQAVIALGCSLLPLAAQSIPQSELIARIKANRSNYGFLDHGPDLRAQADAQGTDVTRGFAANLNEGRCGDCPPPDDANHWRIKRAVRDSDLVVVGTISLQVGALTQNRAFVFTDSEFVVDQVWKSASGIPAVTQGCEITITRPGGTVALDGHKITATLNNVVPFRTGDRYLVFLKYIPASRSYEPVSPIGFDITGPTIQPLQTNIVMPGKQYENNQSSFLQAMHESTDRALAEGGR